MIAAALTASGVRTGLFCSPHLHRLEERFCIDGRPASPAELVALVDAVRPAVDELDADDPHLRHRGPTFFEITTAMGLLHFARRQAGAVVLEVGMGGRLDSTNVVRPVLSVITTISFDHTRQLGKTLGAIATEKAGILKRSRPAVSGVREDEPRQAIRRVAAQRRCPLRELDVDFHFEAIAPRPPVDPPDRRPGRGPDLADRLGRRSSCRCSAPTRRTTRRSRWRASTSWPSRALAGGRPRGGRPGLRRAALAGAGRGAGRVALAGDRRRPQRRLGRGAGRDAPDLVPPDAPDPRLRHDPRQGPARPAPRPPARSSTPWSRPDTSRTPASVPPEEVAAAIAAIDGRAARITRRAGRGPRRWPAG